MLFPARVPAAPAIRSRCGYSGGWHGGRNIRAGIPHNLRQLLRHLPLRHRLCRGAAASAAASSLSEPRAADPSAVSPSCATSGAAVQARRPDDCGCHQLGSRLAGLHANHQPSLPAWGVDGRESAPQKQRRPHDRPPRLPTSLRFRFGRSAGYHSRCAPLHVRVPGLNLASLSE